MLDPAWEWANFTNTHYGAQIQNSSIKYYNAHLHPALTAPDARKKLARMLNNSEHSLINLITTMAGDESEVARNWIIQKMWQLRPCFLNGAVTLLGA